MRATDVLFAILSLISVVGMVTLAIWTFAEEWSVQRFRDIPAYKGRSTVTLGRLLNPIEVELSDLCPWSVEIDEHGRGNDRDVERDGARDLGADVDLGRQHIRMAGFQEDVVEREGFAKALKSLRHRQLLVCGHATAMSSFRDERRRRQS